MPAPRRAILNFSVTLLLFLVALPPALHPQTIAEAVEVDANAAGHPLPHFWEKMFGSGRAILSLREDYRHLTKYQDGEFAPATPAA